MLFSISPAEKQASLKSVQLSLSALFRKPGGDYGKTLDSVPPTELKSTDRHV